MSARRVTVTGGCGFVGSRLVGHLVEGGADQVMVLDDCSLGAPENLGPALEQVSLVKCDVRERDAVVEAIASFSPAVVIHLAATHFIPACDRDPKRCIDVNVGGTQAVLDACEAVGASVVLASTAAVYEPAPFAHGDDARLGPSDIYGLTKLWSEQLGELFHRRSGIPVRAARLFNVFGPGETNPHLIPAIIRQAEAGAELKLGNLTTKRDYVFVDDIARGLADLADLPDEHGWLSCNFGREQAVDGEELVATIGELMDRELRVTSDPDRVRPTDRPLLISDCTRAHEILGWSARFGIEEGLRAAISQPTAVGVEVT